MARTQDGRWLLKNAWRYGFIRRYPPEKSMWLAPGEETHWRYVGPAHAAAMYTGDWCLEEYLEALHRHGVLRLVSPTGQTTWFLCTPMQQNGAAFCIPQGATAAPSADNLGYAVCVITGV